MDITTSPNGILQIRTEQDGENFRYCLNPGDDVSAKPQAVQDAAAATWTQEILGAWATAHPPPSLDDLKASQLQRINALRDRKETEGFAHAGLWFQSDERSVARINSAAITASTALASGQTVAFPDWLAADNTPLPVDAMGMLGLQAALTTHAGALHQYARALKAQVEAATTSAELDAVEVNIGWPGQ